MVDPLIRGATAIDAAARAAMPRGRGHLCVRFEPTAAAPQWRA